jgi:hypothetical protein
VIDREDIDARLARLREATERLRPPPDLAERVMAAARARTLPAPWSGLLVRSGARALAAAAVAVAAVGALLLAQDASLEEAALVASSMGMEP